MAGATSKLMRGRGAGTIFVRKKWSPASPQLLLKQLPVALSLPAGQGKQTSQHTIDYTIDCRSRCQALGGGGGPTLSEADNIDRHFWSGGRDLHAFLVRGDRFLERPNLS